MLKIKILLASTLETLESMINTWISENEKTKDNIKDINILSQVMDNGEMKNAKVAIITYWS